MIKSGFFNSARTVGEVLLYFQRRGIEITARELSGILIRLLQAGLLERRESPKGAYKYRSAK